MLQTVRPITGNDSRSYTIDDSWRNDGFVRFEGSIGGALRNDIKEFIDDVGIPDEFEYDADIKYLFYRDGKIASIFAVNFVPMARVLTPLIVHMIYSKAFRKTRDGYKFMQDMFRDLQFMGYKLVCCHIPNDREYITNPMLKFGFQAYSEDEYGRYYYMELDRI